MIKKIELAPDYEITPVLNGLWQLSRGHALDGDLDQQDIQKAFNLLAERGFTTFDLADIYIGAEDALGKFLRTLEGHSTLTKHDIQIHEKYVPDLDILKTVSFQDTERIVDRSLQKLGRDYIDLMQFHWWDYEIDRYVDVAYNLVKLQEKGKIRNIGVTNFDTKHLKKLVDGGIPVISCQSQYSLFDRRPEKQLLEYCMSEDISHICYGTIAGGFLSEKYLEREQFEPETRSQVKYLQIIEETLGYEGYQQLLVILKEIADKYQVSIANVASRYILQQDGVAGVIIGTRSSRHVESNAQIFEFELTEADLERIKTFVSQFPMIEGDAYEAERTPDSVFRSIIRMNEAEGE